jgi:VanZ family protein
MDFQSRKWKWLASAVACLLIAAIVYFSLTPNPPNLAGNGDKYGHMAGYGLLMFWLMQLYKGGRSRLLIGLGLALLGIGLEVLQAYTGYRTFERGDMLADGIGIALGWLVAPPRTSNVLERIDRSL